jgi:hypothetical protein
VKKLLTFVPGSIVKNRWVITLKNSRFIISAALKINFLKN